MAWFERGTTRIHYEEQGEGDPVLVIPGITLSIDDMRPITEALAPRYRVIAADAPGSGRSTPQPREYPSSYYHDDARAFLLLVESLEATPVRVVGFSDGGEYGLLMAAMDPAAIRSIVAWGAAGVVAASEVFLETLGRVIDDPSPALEGYSRYLKATYGEENARATITSAARALRAIRAAGGDISRARAHEIACPTLLITGEADAVFAPPSQVADLAAAMQNAEFLEARDAGHSVHHDRPEWLIETVVTWLSDH